MSDAVFSDPVYETLPDPWERGAPIPLNGVLERHQFGPLVTAVFALIIGFGGYMLVGNVAILVLLMLSGVGLEEMVRDLPRLMEEQTAILLSANSLGLVLGLGVVAFALARLHSSRVGAFLRLRKPDVPLLALAVVGLAALTPLVQWAGTVNQAIPLPEFLRALEDVQMELIEKVLQGNVSVVFSLVMMALTPAFCEEFFFRGYLQRHLERGLGVVGGVVTTGVVFGLFHLRLTQVLPLSLLGVYLAYLTWQTGSLWVPIVVHFANNAFALATAEVVKNRPDLDLSSIDQVQVPWYLAVGGLLFLVGVVYGMRQRAESLRPPESVVSSPRTPWTKEFTDDEYRHV